MYSIIKLEKKSNDWYVLSLKNPQGQEETNVSVNRVNKKDEVFPNFDALKEGGTVEGRFWKSDAGKSYLFAPNPVSAPKGGMTGGMGAKLVEQKSKNIEHAQDRKSESIMISSTAGQATQILVSIMGKLEPTNDTEWKKEWLSIRYWLVQNWNNIESPKTSDGSEMPNFGEDEPF